MPPFLLALLPWAKEKALPWLLAHWKDLGLVILALLIWHCWGVEKELRECQAQLSAKPAELSQHQDLSGTAHAASRVIYRQVPGKPCPEVEVVSEAEIQHWASQEQTLTPSNSSAPALQSKRVDFWIGSSLSGLSTAGLKVDVARYGPANFGLGVSSPLDRLEAQGLISASFPLPSIFQ